MLYHTLKIVLNTRLLIIKNIIQYFSNELQRVYDENYMIKCKKISLSNQTKVATITLYIKESPKNERERQSVHELQTKSHTVVSD